MRNLQPIKNTLAYYKAGFLLDKSEDELLKQLLTDLFFLMQEKGDLRYRALLAGMFYEAEATHVRESDPPAFALWEKYREAAHDIHHQDGEVEVDSNARVSESESGGAYVEAWVWVNSEELDEEEHEPHDIQCVECGVSLNNQCLNEECEEDNDHPSEDLKCDECQFNPTPRPCTDTWHHPPMFKDGKMRCSHCGHEFTQKEK